MTDNQLWRNTGGELVGRLKAWWFGVDYRELTVPDSASASDTELAAEALRSHRAGEVDTTPVDRLALAQMIWGPGFLMPGGIEQIMTVVKPMGVNPAMSLLDLTAGLGGPSRHVSQTFDVYITGLERSPEIAKRGQAMSVAAGLGRKVPITAYDPETIELRPHAFDCVYAQHATLSIVDKERFLREVIRCLKARGQFSFTDFVLRDGDVDDRRIDRMRELERYPPMPWRVSQYIDCLTNAGFDCRIAEDQTELFRSQVLAGWETMLKTVNLRAMPKRHLLALLDEADLWVRRMSAVDHGTLSVYRFYAISTYGAPG